MASVLFTRSSNRKFRLLLALCAAAVVGIPALLMVWVRTPLATGQHDAPLQPVLFSHQLHVRGFAIDCRYCHASVERAASAGMPATQQCVPCHSAAWRSSAIFAPVRHSLGSGRAIPWVRVNALPDYVFFNHAIHVGKGVGCETCHGAVDRMAVMEQAAPLTMGWCVDCHRDPVPHLRPVAAVTTIGFRYPAAASAMLARKYHVQPGINCSACHR